MAQLTHNREWITRYISVNNSEKIITLIVQCDYLCLDWQREYYETGNKNYLEFAKNARVRYLSGLVALSIVLRREHAI